jgi:nitrite reductase (NADH) large subunit
MTLQPVLAWFCPICGYIHYGAEPPDECPVCGAEKELFVPYEEPQKSTAKTEIKEKVIIVGAGIAGVSAAETLRKTDPAAEILLLSSDSIPPYYRINLTRYLAGDVKESDLPLHPQDWYYEHAIDLLLNSELGAIDAAKKQITLADGETNSYDKLILTTGANPFIPPFPGKEKKNVLTLRTKEDADLILQICQPGKKVVCIGGGILGLENAGALARRGVEVTVLEDQPWLLSRQLNQNASQAFETFVKGLGIITRTDVKTKELVGDETVQAIHLESGEQLPVDVVIISTGVRSNIAIAKNAGLEVNHGIVVNDSMQTSDPNIYAGGDAAEHNGVIYGTWNPAQAEGMTAGSNSGGGEVTFIGLPRSNKLKVLGIELFSIGATSPVEDGDILMEERSDGKYTSFIFRGNVMVGAILLGDASLSGKVIKVIENKVELSGLSQGKIDVHMVREILASN